MPNYLTQTELLTALEQKLDHILSSASKLVKATNLLAAMRYSVLNSGKKIRAQLLYASGIMSGANSDTLLTLGAIIELVHCYSLIHDDLPAMDNDDWRRGKLSCHKQYNEATAILAGDALAILAFTLLSAKSLDLPALLKLDLINLLATTTGLNGMIGGQAIDLAASDGQLSLHLAELQQMHQLKTASLIKYAILTGYLCGNAYMNHPITLHRATNLTATNATNTTADTTAIHTTTDTIINTVTPVNTNLTYNKLEQIADNMGVLFQIVDDILDATATTAQLGKTANKDAACKKITYVSLCGLEQAKTIAKDLYTQLEAEILQLPLTNKDFFKQLFATIYYRDH